ncbi:MAG: RIP metalloprotease RseP [Sumerlaeia bacterium]
MFLDLLAQAAAEAPAAEPFLSRVGSFLVGLLGFVTAFGLAVFIHELGHFLAAKAFKVPVERFVIGFDREAMPFMPKCIWERTYGETTYGLSLMPLGGYVKMAGTIHPDIERYIDGDAPKEGELTETDAAGLEVLTHATPSKQQPAEADTDTDKPASLSEQALQDQAALYKKPFWQKTIVYGAGVTMNMLLAMVIVTIMLVKGEKIDKPLPAVVAWQSPNSALVQQGLEPGDRIVSIHGTPVSTDREVYEVLGKLANPTVIEAPGSDVNEGTTITVTIGLDRGGEQLTRTVDYHTAEFFGEDALISRPASVEYVVLYEPASKGGVKEGDLILEVEGTPVQDWFHLVHLISQSANEDMSWIVRRKDQDAPIQLTVTPREEEIERPGLDPVVVGRVGIQYGALEKEVAKVGLGEAILIAPGQIVRMTKGYLSNLGRLGKNLAQGDVQTVRRELGGPVAIGHMAGHHANLGLDRFLQFMVMLNIALAVMNLLPLPVLDGGHIVLAGYEAVVGKPVPPKILVPILNGAVIFLLGFVLLVSFSDLLKIFS